jgi:hypothetical protein
MVASLLLAFLIRVKWAQQTTSPINVPLSVASNDDTVLPNADPTVAAQIADETQVGLEFGRRGDEIA